MTSRMGELWSAPRPRSRRVACACSSSSDGLQRTRERSGARAHARCLAVRELARRAAVASERRRRGRGRAEGPRRRDAEGGARGREAPRTMSRGHGRHRRSLLHRSLRGDADGRARRTARSEHTLRSRRSRPQRVRAVSAPDVFPQGYISAVEAQRACSESGKRLCRVAEWEQGVSRAGEKSFGYGDRREPGRCNDNGQEPGAQPLRSRRTGTGATMNQPR